MGLLRKSFERIGKIEKTEKKEKKEKKYPLFSFKSSEDVNIIYLSGIWKKNLYELSSIINHPIEKIFEFLVLFKQGISQNFSSILFGKNQSSISRNIHKIINQFEKSFLDDNIGSKAFSRDKIIKNHIPFYFYALFPEVKGIIDSTYFYIEKSEVFEFQKKSF